jgi:tripartite-type tricarboxylate transporter receptor subunit TctC
VLALLGLAPLVAAGAARAQSYPTKPIRLIVADAPGGAPDQLGRIVAQRLSDALGQQVVVDNKPGASGILGADAAAHAEPDGHVLLLSTTAIWAIMPSVKKTLPYEPTTSFVPITRIATASNVLVVNPDLPAKNVAELVALAKASPGRINYASAGVASPAHLAGEMLNLRGGVKMTHIPYKGAAPALLDVIAGAAQLIITSPVSAGGHIANGKVRALATTGAQRNPVLPDLPTIGETLPGYDISQSWGLVAPAGTPQPIVQRLYSEIAKALAAPEVRERIAKTGAVPVTEAPEAFAGFMVTERQRLGDVIVKSGIALND